jgi:hypothetical protein
MKYTRQMMKPGERFVLLRTGERYVVDDNGALFNESKNRSAKLHGNCEVEPIKISKREWVGLTDEDVIKTYELRDLWWMRDISIEDLKEFADSIEAKLKEKNT